MKEDLLLKYIAGNASQQEKEEVAAWIDADVSHLHQLLSLRKSYDAFLWQDTTRQRTTVLQNRRPIARLLRVAAMLAIAFGLGYLLHTTIRTETEAEIQSISVPAGQRTQLTLADGTVVWVNGESTLSFPSRFDRNQRRVELQGEAYFDVQKDPKRQFVVAMPHQTAIRVLGTKFNVRAYADAERVVTTLTEGNVRFEFERSGQRPQYIALARGQKLIYDAPSGRTEMHATSGERELAWKDGLLIFRRTSLREALDMLAERYGAEFTIAPGVPHDDAFTGTFANRSLEQILHFISASSRIKWRYLNNHEGAGKEKIRIEIFV